MRLSMIAVAAAWLLATPALAHDIYFAPRAKQVALVYGEGADDLDMVKRLPKLAPLVALDSEGKPVAAQMIAKGIIPVVEAAAPYALVAAMMDYGFWTRRPDGEFEEATKDKVAGAIMAQHSMKYALHLTRLDNTKLPLVAGHRLQVMPADSTIPAQSGAIVKIRVFLDGKPVAGATVLPDCLNDPDGPAIPTDGEGLASFRIRNQGLNVVSARLLEKSSEPKKYDVTEHLATLSFILPHATE
jgi:nickel transport protein